MVQQDPQTALPEVGDLLFVDKDRAFDAHVVGDPAERFFRLPHGYKQAADAIVLRAAAEPSERPNLIYPALYCYRQSIELWLKKLIKDYGAGVVLPPMLKARVGHNLIDLWMKFEAIASDRQAAGDPHFKAAKALVSEMHQADEVNDCFRYAADKKDNPFAFGNRNIDLDNLYGRMNALVNFFECTDLMFDSQNNQ